jgi:predicted transcriptional regulator
MALARPRTRGDYYRRIRRALGLPLSAIAYVSGYSQAYLSCIETGERPLLPHVEDVLRVVYDKELRRAYEAAAMREVA